MNTNPTYQLIRRKFLTVLLAGLGTLPCYAQFTFNSGSNETYGPMNITANTTLDMQTLAPDGIFNCTTINVAAGATLKFTPNSLNTPVYLLATGDVSVSGTIDVSGSMGTGTLGGAGGPGGFSGGNPGNVGLLDGCGHGPGAGPVGGPASYGTTASLNSGYYPTAIVGGVVYGSPLLIPLIGGSGGAGSAGTGGEGGGGAVLIASNTRIEVSGGVAATSPDLNVRGFFGLGSGGAIRLVAQVVSGNGKLNVNGSQQPYTASCGGAGRIRIDCIERRTLALTCVPSLVATIGANMMTFPPNAPHLDITQAAGTNLAVGTDAPVFFMLPPGTSPNQTVTVQASNFGAVVPIRVVLTPDNGSATSYDVQIDNSAAGSASVTVPVVMPVNMQVHIEAWTR